MRISLGSEDLASAPGSENLEQSLLLNLSEP